MDNKNINPIYFWISENLFTDITIAAQKKDLDSFALDLACYTYKKPQLQEKFDFLYKSLSEEKFRIRYSVAICILFYLHQREGLSVKRDDIACINTLFEELHARRDVPFKNKTLCYYFLQKSGVVTKLEEFLKEQQKKFLEQNNFDDLVEVEFALGKGSFSVNQWSKFEDYPNFDISKLSKLGLLYKETNMQEKVKEVVSLIEQKIWEKISKASLPTISLLIYEAERLISTNLPSKELGETLDTLKKQNNGWAKLISSIQTDGVTVDVANFSHISRLTTEDICWGIKLIQEAGYDKVYQISSNDFADFSEFREQKNEKVLQVSTYSLISFIVWCGLLLILTYIYFEHHGLSILLYLLKNITTPNQYWIDFKAVPFLSWSTVGEILAFPVIFVAVALGVGWRSWKYLRNQHRFGVKYALQSLLFIWDWK